MKKPANKKLTPVFLPLLALSLAVLLRPVCSWTETVFSPALGRAALLVLSLLGASTAISYMLPISRLRSVLHGIGEFFYPLFLTALPLLVVADIVYYFRLPVSPGTGLAVFGAAFVLLAAAGLPGGLGLRVKQCEAEIPGAAPLSLVLLSDLHLGYFTPGSFGGKLADAILEQKPDAVIIAGDLFDDRFDSLPEERRERVRAGFKRLSAAVPVYACEGNHDLLCPDPRKDAFLEDCGIRVLRDESVTLNGTRFLFRRDTKNSDRRELAELLPDGGAPTVTVDHNPFRCAEAFACGASLVLSGHTHGGQTFPGTLMYRNKRICGYGFFRYNGRQLLVTSGAGIYGFPIRLGISREIVNVKIADRAPDPAGKA